MYRRSGMRRKHRTNNFPNGDTREKIPMYRVFFYGTKVFIKYTPVLFLCSIFLAVPNALLRGYAVLATQRLFDSVENAFSGELYAVYKALIILGAVLVFTEIVAAFHVFTVRAFYDKNSGGIQRMIHKKMSRIDPIAFENVEFHDDMEKADRGKWNVMGLTETIWDMLGFFIPYFIFMGFYLHHVNPRFVLAIAFVFLPILIAQILRTKIISKFVDVTAPIRREHDFYYNAITNRYYYKETRILGIYNFFLGRYLKTLKSLSRAELSANRKVNFIELALSFLTIAGYVGILFMIISALLGGEISVGAFAAVYSSIASLFYMMDGLIRRRIGQAAEGMGYAHNFMRFMNLPERESTDEILPDTSKGIEMQNVSFTYPLAEKKSVDGINLEIHAGETVAIVGENGAGKSTLVRLLIGLYKPDEGKILFGGVETSKAKLKTLFENISGVFQKFQMYQLTLRDNIRMGNRYVDDEISESLSAAGIELSAATYPEGEETMLGREFDGVDLSGGQWQRVAIARGLYRAHNIVVLDEPTAAIDPIEESRIYEKFIEISKNKTAIIVTHRLGSTKIADRVIVMQNGKINDIGNHEELIARKGLYAEMFLAQAEWYETG